MSPVLMKSNMVVNKVRRTSDLSEIKKFIHNFELIFFLLHRAGKEICPQQSCSNDAKQAMSLLVLEQTRNSTRFQLMALCNMQTTNCQQETEDGTTVTSASVCLFSVFFLF